MIVNYRKLNFRPIECWLPAEYKSSWEDYRYEISLSLRTEACILVLRVSMAFFETPGMRVIWGEFIIQFSSRFSETFCWARSTYWVPFDQQIPKTDQDREVNLVSYYQWAPFFLVACAFLFYAPCLIWRSMYDRSGKNHLKMNLGYRKSQFRTLGIRLRDIIRFANDPANVQTSTRQANIAGLADHLGSIFKHRYRMDGSSPLTKQLMRFLNIRYYEAYLTWLYLSIKFMFLLNVMWQVNLQYETWDKRYSL